MWRGFPHRCDQRPPEVCAAGFVWSWDQPQQAYKRQTSHEALPQETPRKKRHVLCFCVLVLREFEWADT